MIRNYFKTAFRNIVRQKIYSLIIVLGLTIGITVFGLILMYVNNEFHVDSFNKNIDRIYRLETEDWAILGTAYGPELAANLPEISEFTRISSFEGASVNIKRDEDLLKLEHMLYADSSFFKIFSFNMVAGDPQRALSTPFSVVLTESEAKRIFGNNDPMGKLLKINNKFDFTVTGIVKDVPRFHMKTNAIASFHSLRYMYNDSSFLEHYDQWNYYTFFLLKENTNPKLLENKIINYYTGRANWKDTKPFFQLRPLKEIYFTQVKNDMASQKSNKSMMYLLMAVGVFILVIACVNFINLTTARSAKRSQEIGIRKTMGASKANLMFQFLGEAILITLISTELALVLMELLKPEFCNLVGKDLTIETDTKIWFLVLAIPFPIIIGIISGFYPALYLNRFQPISAIKKLKTRGTGSLLLRRTLIVFQFTISIFLIIATLTVYKQLNYIKNKELGFTKDQVVLLGLNNDLLKNKETFRERLLSNPGITNVSFSTQTFGNITWQESVRVDADRKQFTFLGVDPEFTQTMGLTLKEGKLFNRLNPTDKGKVIINEETARFFQLKNPIGTDIGSDGRKLEVIGVLKDFNFNSLHKAVPPLVVMWNDNFVRFANIKISGSPMEAMHHIKKVWSELCPDFIFEYNFLDESFDNLYKSEMKLGKTFIFLALLAIIIASMGLLGLSSYLAEQRTKEIGVRKVLGASEGSIVWKLTSEFTTWVLISGLIAVPAAWIVMDKWLCQFAYHTYMDWSIFLCAWAIALVIAAVTVSWQSFKVALNNPSEALRYE